MLRAALPTAFLCLLTASCVQPTKAGTAPVQPLVRTAQVGTDADDPAFWVHPTDPARSLLLATDKVASPGGALYVFGLDGLVRQKVGPLDRPNNVDVEYGLATPAGPIDIAVVTERFQYRLRVFRVSASGLRPLDGGTGIPVLAGQTGEGRMPMGIALYRRPADGAIFALVAPKTGDTTDYLWQYRLEMDPGTGLVGGTLVRRFGNFSGTSEVEAVAVDDELGYVYYADEEYAVRKWRADPDHPDAARELAVFATDGFHGQREGIAIVRQSPRSGYVVVSDQIEGGSRLHVFPRQGGAAGPHDHPRLADILTSADDTDGIDLVSAPLGPDFPAGALAMMNSRERNFLLFDWRTFAAMLTP